MNNRKSSVTRSNLWLRTVLWLRHCSQLMLLLALACSITIGWIGLSLLAAQARIDEAQGSLAQRLSAPAAGVVAAAAMPHQRLDALLSVLPPERTADDHIRQLFVIAANEGLELSQAEYSRSGNEVAGLIRLTLRLPMQGSYVSVSRFISRALAQMPFLAVDAMVVRRDQPGDPEVEAALKLSLFMHREQP